MTPGTDTWICSKCQQAIPIGDWDGHREAHINEYTPRAS